MTNPTPLHIEEPLSIDDARRASRTLATQRRIAEDNLESAVTKAAETERDYRKSLAVAFVKNTEGTAAQREAQARADVAKESYERDVAAGMVKVCQERLRGLEGERSQLRALMDLSAKVYGAAA
jgi:hypothetical protein